MTRKRVLAALGDSQTAGNPGWDPDPARRAAEGANDPQSTYLYWVAERFPELEVRNHGVGGERTDEIRARLDDAAEGADVVLVQGGINNIYQGRGIDGASADVEAMVQELKRRGIAVLVADVLPWNNGWPDAEPQIRELNRRIAAIAEAEGVPLLPFHDTLEDPERPGRMREDWTAEGDHPSVAGHRRLGELAFSLLD